MNNITEKEIRNLEDILLRFGEAHNMLAKTSLSKEEYQPISTLLASAKVELFKFYKERKAALQNKVSDVSAEEVLFNRIVSFKKIEDKNDEYFFPYKSSDEMVKQESICKVFIGAMQEYASIVNERNENIPADFKQITGHDSPKEMKAYEKGREDEQQVIIEWIEKWDGSSNSVMGALLKKKFNELFTYLSKQTNSHKLKNKTEW